MPAGTPGFLITSRQHDRWRLQLANCDADHAQSVLDQMSIDPSVPDELELTPVDDIYADHVEGRLIFVEPDEVPIGRRIGRLFGG